MAQNLDVHTAADNLIVALKYDFAPECITPLQLLVEKNMPVFIHQKFKDMVLSSKAGALKAVEMIQKLHSNSAPRCHHGNSYYNCSYCR